MLNSKFSPQSGTPYQSDSLKGKAGGLVFQNSKERGFALVELVVAIGITATFLFAALQFVSVSARVMRTQRFASEATLLLAEAEDGLKFLRNAGWTANITPVPLETTYYLNFSGGSWSLTTINPGAINGLYTRTLVLHQVLRDASNNIVASGGTADQNSRGVTVTVSWTGVSGIQTIANDLYVDNILRN